MILVDTSIWVDHLGRTNPLMQDLLETYNVVIHPFVTGEILLGNVRHRPALTHRLMRMPQARVATNDEVLRLIAAHELFGSGIGYVDAHLLASTLLVPGTTFWTRDKYALACAERLDVAAHLTN